MLTTESWTSKVGTSGLMATDDEPSPPPELISTMATITATTAAAAPARRRPRLPRLAAGAAASGVGPGSVTGRRGTTGGGSTLAAVAADAARAAVAADAARAAPSATACLG